MFDIDGDLGIKNLWTALYWLKMSYDRVCPMCGEQLQSGTVRHDYLEWHLEKTHPELLAAPPDNNQIKENKQ